LKHPAAVLIGLVLYAEILLYGADRTELALTFCGLWFLALAVLLTRRWAQRALAGLRLAGPALCFAAVLGAGALSLTPWAIGGANRVWTWVAGARPSASIDPYLTLIELLKLLGLAAAFLIGAVFGAEDVRAKGFIRWILGLGLAYSLWAITDRATHPAELFGAPRIFDPSRLSASLSSANSAATFFGALTVLDLIDADRRFQAHGLRGRLDLRRLERIAPQIAISLISLAAAATCLILTLSRSGLAASGAIVITLMGAATIARARRGAVAALAVMAIVSGVFLGLVALNLGVLQERLSFLGDDARTRRAILAAHWAAFRASPASGYGLGTFSHVNAMITSPGSLEALGPLGAAHNLYLQWLEQAGLVGALPALLLIIVLGVRIAAGAAARRLMRSWLVGVLAVLALFLIHGATDFALEVPALATFLSLLLGLGWGMAQAPPTGRSNSRRTRAAELGEKAPT
jgi:hypothetical protein